MMKRRLGIDFLSGLGITMLCSVNSIPLVVHGTDSVHFLHIINLLTKTDLRRNGWLVGLMYSSTGDELRCSEESAPNPLNLTVDFVNIYDPTDPATYDHRNALEYHGPRLR
jgi:hypothetical protein